MVDWHFIHFVKPREYGVPYPFGYVQFIGIASCFFTQQSPRIVLWTDGEIAGEWFALARPFIDSIKQLPSPVTQPGWQVATAAVFTNQAPKIAPGEIRSASHESVAGQPIGWYTTAVDDKTLWKKTPDDALRDGACWLEDYGRKLLRAALINHVTNYAKDSEDRLTNLDIISQFYADYNPFGTVLTVCGEDPGPAITARFRTVLRVPRQAKWNRSKLNNAMLPWCTAQTVHTADVDMLCDPGALDTAALHAWRKGGMVITAKDHCIQVGRGFVRNLDTSSAMAMYRSVKPEYTIGNINGISYNLVFNAADLRHLRGFNEEFTNWGLEDSELLNRFLKLGYPVVRIGVDLYHLEHDRGTATVAPDDTFSERAARTSAFEARSPESIAAYYGIARQTGHYSRALSKYNGFVSG